MMQQAPPMMHYPMGIIVTPSHVPMYMRCYVCAKDGVTRVEKSDGAAMWGTCIICCICLGIFSGCGACAFCFDDLKDVSHHCSHCGALIAIRKPCN